MSKHMTTRSVHPPVANTDCADPFMYTVGRVFWKGDHCISIARVLGSPDDEDSDFHVYLEWKQLGFVHHSCATYDEAVAWSADWLVKFEAFIKDKWFRPAAPSSERIAGYQVKGPVDLVVTYLLNGVHHILRRVFETFEQAERFLADYDHLFGEIRLGPNVLVTSNGAIFRYRGGKQRTLGPLSQRKSLAPAAETVKETR